jgi:hypothetical protein
MKHSETLICSKLEMLNIYLREQNKEKDNLNIPVVKVTNIKNW